MRYVLNMKTNLTLFHWYIISIVVNTYVNHYMHVQIIDLIDKQTVFNGQLYFTHVFIIYREYIKFTFKILKNEDFNRTIYSHK